MTAILIIDWFDHVVDALFWSRFRLVASSHPLTASIVRI